MIKLTLPILSVLSLFAASQAIAEKVEATDHHYLEARKDILHPSSTSVESTSATDVEATDYNHREARKEILHPSSASVESTSATHSNGSRLKKAGAAR